MAGPSFADNFFWEKQTMKKLGALLCVCAALLLAGCPDRTTPPPATPDQTTQPADERDEVDVVEEDTTTEQP
jgi:hypothetical protein